MGINQNSGSGPPKQAFAHDPATIDHHLLVRIAQKDRSAFGEFFDRHAPRVRGVISRMLGARDGVDDLLQETFWQIWLRAETYDASRASPVAWLSLIARSRAIDHLRVPREPIDRDKVPRDRSDGNGSGLETQSEKCESLDLARRALGDLPPEQREVLLLSYFSGMSHQDISRRLALPLGTIKTRIRLGMLRLRERLDPRERCEL